MNPAATKKNPAIPATLRAPDLSTNLSAVTDPVIYEINTWPWLDELSRDAGRPVDLGSVPARFWDELAALGIDAVWLMGVWQRSPAGIAIALDNPGLTADFDAALPGWRPADVVGSPYCIRNYLVDEHLGGPDALAVARAELAARGIGLVLDFVPNHVAPDHPWVTDRPGCSWRVPRTTSSATRSPSSGSATGSLPTAAIHTSRRGRTWSS